MLLYCHDCNNLIGKIVDETLAQGSTIERKCARCGHENRYYVQYKAIIDRRYDKLRSSYKSGRV